MADTPVANSIGVLLHLTEPVPINLELPGKSKEDNEKQTPLSPSDSNSPLPHQPPPKDYSHAHSQNTGADVFESTQASKRSSFSSPPARGQGIVADSAVSLHPLPTPDPKVDDVGAAAITEKPRGDDVPEAIPPTYLSPAKTAVVMASLYISIFLVALDRTIIGPAIPAITNQFQSIDDIGWYGSAYMLTSCGFILFYGRIYTIFPTKPVFLSGIFLFEAGSAFCGAANSSLMLIIGRAIAGLGSSGIFTGAILTMVDTVPLHRRPMLQGLFGACFGVASVTGPLLGGAFTQSQATWRWCFYINLPLGAITVIVVFLLLHLEPKPRLGSWKDTVKSLDPVGTVLFLVAVTCLLLALESGAAEHSWSDGPIITYLTLFGVLFVAFALWQFWTQDTTATIPARILFQRSVAFGGLSQFFVGSTMLTASIYIPLWFQAITGASAMQSGINTIPLVLSVVTSSILSGGLVQRIGYYTPFMILGSCLMAIGAGLLTTWSSTTAARDWIGFQIILGLGVGFTMQHPNLAVQIVLPPADIPTGTALLSLCQTLGGAIFVSVGQNVFMDKFISTLGTIDGLDVSRLVGSGVTDLIKSVPAPLRQRVLEAYNTSLTHGPFFAALIVACFAVLSALGMEFRKVNTTKESNATSQA